jgi:hypothetical protein
MKLNGTFRNGAIIIDEKTPFIDGEKLTIEIVPKSQSRKKYSVAEILEIFSNVSINTDGWKFNREEANSRSSNPNFNQYLTGE